MLAVGAVLACAGPYSCPTARGQSPAAPAGGPVTLPRARQFDLRSSSGRVYRIFVAAPRDQAEAPAAGWPVVYLTDGNSNFPVLLAAARQRASDDPRAVVVGIGYPEADKAVHIGRRYVDLAPPSSDAPTPAPPADPRGPPGNDQFLGFLVDELKPLIERTYRTDPGRQALFGHSLGGLFVLHVLFTRPGAFQTYVAVSPSVWWADGGVLAEEEAFTREHAGKEIHARLLIAVGEWEQRPRSDVPPAKQAQVAKRGRMVVSARELADRLSRSPVKGLGVTFRAFAEEDHGTVVLPAAGRGMRFALDEK